MRKEMQQDLIELEKVYRQTLPVPCNRCGRCCICPHLSFIELIPLLHQMVEVFSAEELRAMVAAEPVISEYHMSNIACPLLKDNACSCYATRPLSCRLEGIDILDELTHRERICSYQKGAVSRERFGGAEIENLLEAATGINARYCGMLEEPYYFDSVNIYCWFAVMFDRDITQQFFLDLRGKIFAEIDLSYLADSYVNHTRLNEKLDLIDRFFVLNEEKKAVEALECMKQVNEGFIYTGAYFYPQSNVYINFMTDLVKKLQEDNQ